MKCPGKTFPWEDYLEHRFRDERTQQLRMHLQICADCRANLQQAEALRGMLTRLPRRMTPGRDLWRDIEQRIRFGPGKTGAAGNSRIYCLVPLATAALLVVGFLVASLVQEAQPAFFRASLTRLISIGGDGASIVRRFSDIERRYQKVKDGFLEAVESRNAAMDPGFVKMVKDQLEIIDQAVYELQTALEAQPENRRLWSLMAQANENRMEILQTAQTHLY
jgi:hypothetical protein